jgi:hypothetical protein
VIDVFGAASPPPHPENFNVIQGKQVIDQVTAHEPGDSGDKYAL